MRIAFVSNLLPPAGTGGAELYVAQAARELGARHTVAILSGTQTDIPGVSTHRLPGLGPLAHDAPLHTKLIWHARDQWMPRVGRVAAETFQAFQPDVVYTHEPQGLSAAVFGAVAGGGYRHVHMTHDFNLACARVTMTVDGRPCEGNCSPCRFQRAIRLRALMRRIDRVVAPSEMIRERHISLGIPADKVVLIRHGAEGNARTHEPEGARRVIGFIGTLSAHKGLHTLLDAFSAAPPEWSLRIAGTGPLECLVRSRVAADSRLSYRGFVSDHEKDSFYAGLDALVVPSECEEVAPLVVVEAAVRGVPLVVSDRGGLVEAPASARFTAGDPSALRVALHDLLESRERLMLERHKLLRRRADFTWARHITELESVLREVASAA